MSNSKQPWRTTRSQTLYSIPDSNEECICSIQSEDNLELVKMISTDAQYDERDVNIASRIYDTIKTSEKHDSILVNDSEANFQRHSEDRYNHSPVKHRKLTFETNLSKSTQEISERDHCNQEIIKSERVQQTNLYKEQKSQRQRLQSPTNIKKIRPSLRRAKSEFNCDVKYPKKLTNRGLNYSSFNKDCSKNTGRFDSTILEMPVELLDLESENHSTFTKKQYAGILPMTDPYGFGSPNENTNASGPGKISRNQIRRMQSTANDTTVNMDNFEDEKDVPNVRNYLDTEMKHLLTRHTSFDSLSCRSFTHDQKCPIIITQSPKTASRNIQTRMPDYGFSNNDKCTTATTTTTMPNTLGNLNVISLADGSLLEQNSEIAKQSTSSYLKEQFLAFFQPSDNKLAMKLFGSKNALLKEKRRQEQQGKWVIHPCSSFRFYWDLLMLVLLIANLIILPVAISFFNDDLSVHWIVFNTISDVIFVADIAVKFRTGVVANDYADEIILNPKEIARHYLRSWFILDFISSIPMDYIYLIFNNKDHYNQILSAGRTLRILRLAKLLSMLRLLRLTRLVRYVSQWEEFLNIASKFMGIFNLVLLMLLLGHWNACLQYLIPMLMEFPPDSWVKRCKLEHADWFQQYTWALFKAMSHMLSIGYGRFPPISISDAWITIVSMMSGATCYALFVGHAAALIQSFDTSKRLYREKFKQVEEYMAYRKLPRALRQRIANYYEHRYQGKMFDEAQILNEFSECLREQVINYNCRALVAAVPFFTYADQDFVSEVVTKLKFEVFQPGDLIIKEGTIGNKMYFIQEGIVDIITKDGDVATSLSDGSYFGEIGLLTNARRVASVKAVVYSNLYSLDRESFLSVLENYPLMRRTMESVAAERLSKIGQNPAIVSTREDLKEDLSLVKEIVSSAVTPESTATEDETEQEESQSYLNLRNFLKIGKSRKSHSRSRSETPTRLNTSRSAVQLQQSPTGTKRNKMLHPNVCFVGRFFRGTKHKQKTDHLFSCDNLTNPEVDEGDNKEPRATTNAQINDAESGDSIKIIDKDELG